MSELRHSSYIWQEQLSTQQLNVFQDLTLGFLISDSGLFSYKPKDARTPLGGPKGAEMKLCQIIKLCFDSDGEIT